MCQPTYQRNVSNFFTDIIQSILKILQKDFSESALYRFFYEPKQFLDIKFPHESSIKSGVNCQSYPFSHLQSGGRA